jgi:hypothetical protein
VSRWPLWRQLQRAGHRYAARSIAVRSRGQRSPLEEDQFERNLRATVGAVLAVQRHRAVFRELADA